MISKKGPLNKKTKNVKRFAFEAIIRFLKMFFICDL